MKLNYFSLVTFNTKVLLTGGRAHDSRAEIIRDFDPGFLILANGLFQMTGVEELLTRVRAKGLKYSARGSCIRQMGS